MNAALKPVLSAAHLADLDPAHAYREGMRLLAAGVCLITTEHQGQYAGMIATAVTSVSAEPPTLLICVNHSASICQTLHAAGRFCVNVLATDALPLVDLFSNSARRDERFSSGDWLPLPSGAPASSEAVVAFDCTVAKVLDWHTHSIFLGEVTGVFQPRSQAQPLLYMDRRFHHLSALPLNAN